MDIVCRKFSSKIKDLIGFDLEMDSMEKFFWSVGVGLVFVIALKTMERR